MNLNRFTNIAVLWLLFCPTQIAWAQTEMENRLLLEGIRNRFPAQPPTSSLHATNIGNIVWSNRPIRLSVQDTAALKSIFSPSDAIYGRAYLSNTIGNIPLYVGDSTRPITNQRLSYEIRLRVNGKALPKQSGIFFRGQLRGDAGMKWTTWQFNPYPLLSNRGIGRMGQIWRSLTQDLQEGKYRIWFDIWAVMGIYRSRMPISAGGFTLVVGDGRKITPTDKLPTEKFSGRDLSKIKNGMRRVLLGRVALKSEDILKISIPDNWQTGTYQINKKPFRTLTGTVLWRDSDKNGICRFDSYTFVSGRKNSTTWAPLKFQTYCLDCAAGETKCP